MSFDPNPIGNFMFSFVPVMIAIGFILVFGLILFNIIKGIGRWNYNNAQPVLSVAARVVSKRTDVSGSGMSHGNDHMAHHHHTYTSYYITFEVESGDRMELKVQDHEYGMLAEDDAGKLTFQGTRYLGFERVKA